MKRLLFVDDEKKVLDGIRRMLHGDRCRWELEFALNAEEAVRACELSRFDVVVTDMRMPGTDGATLLVELQKRFPDTARIVLSGQYDSSVATKSVSVAHRVLAKPCDAAELRNTIERVVTLKDLIASPEIRQIVGRIGGLPSLSSTYASLTDAVRDPKTSIDRVAAIVERDVAMAAKVLQLTNSAFFGLSQHVTSLSNAVSYLGMDTIRNLALTSEAFRVFRPDPRIESSVCDSIQSHAIEVAAIAGALPVKSKMREVAVVAGLLHDIGKLFLASTMHDAYCAVTARVNASGCAWWEAEVEILGTSHAEIGAYLLGLWGIPELVIEAIAHHHHPDRIPHSDFDATEVLFVANLLAKERPADSKAPPDCQLDDRSRALLETLGLQSRMEEFRELARASRNRL